MNWHVLILRKTLSVIYVNLEDVLETTINSLFKPKLSKFVSIWVLFVHPLKSLLFYLFEFWCWLKEWIIKCLLNRNLNFFLFFLLFFLYDKIRPLIYRTSGHCIFIVSSSWVFNRFNIIAIGWFIQNLLFIFFWSNSFSLYTLSFVKLMHDHFVGLVAEHKACDKYFLFFLCDDRYWVVEHHHIGLLFDARNVCERDQDFSFLAEDCFVIEIRMEAQTLISHVQPTLD